MSDAPATPMLNPDQVKVTVMDLNNQEVFFHVKRHHKVMKHKKKLADLYNIDVNSFRLCCDSEVLQRDALTFETIPNVQEDDLEEGLKLEMRTSQEGGA